MGRGARESGGGIAAVVGGVEPRMLARLVCDEFSRMNERVNVLVARRKGLSFSSYHSAGKGGEKGRLVETVRSQMRGYRRRRTLLRRRTATDCRRDASGHQIGVAKLSKFGRECTARAMHTRDAHADTPR